MMLGKVKVLIVDDSATTRKLLSMGFAGDPAIEVIGEAHNGDSALRALNEQRPDVITLDLEMPGTDGMTFLRRLMSTRPIPTVVISSMTRQDVDVTVRALEAGAVDFISKPSVGLGDGLRTIMADICARVKAAAASNPSAQTPAPRMEGRDPAIRAARLQRLASRPVAAAAGLIVIGASTGGVQALHQILPQFPSHAPGITIVQHMPEGFTNSFARQLDQSCKMQVREAVDGDVVEPGLILIAPGGRRHLKLERGGLDIRVRLVEGEPVCFSRPAVDVMFESAAVLKGPRIGAALLTGMGRDGAKGLLALRKAGAWTFAQNEATCVVYGMPQAAATLGAAHELLPLDDIPARLLRAATESPPQPGPVLSGRLAP